MSHARLGRGQRRVGIEVVVGAQNLREVLVDDDGTVHLGELEKTVRREGNVQLETIVAGCQDVLGISDADESA